LTDYKLQQNIPQSSTW